MAGAPVPIPISDAQTPILCIADLKEAASKRLPNSARGNTHVLTKHCFLVLKNVNSSYSVFSDSVQNYKDKKSSIQNKS